MHRVGQLLLLLAALLSWSWVSPLAEADESTPKTILILNSYHEGYRWTDDIMMGINTLFPMDAPEYSIRVEYMDTKRYADQAYLDHLFHTYRAKYSELNIDLVITSDDAAYNLLLEKGEELFGGAPAVFCGVNSFDPGTIAGRTGITGVVEGYDIRATIETALALHPNTSTIYYLNDATVSGRSILKEFLKTQRAFSEVVTFKELSGRNIEELSERAGELPSDALLLMLIYFRDPEGRSYSYSEVIERLAQVSSVPIYGVWDFHLGHGIVGGRLTRGYFQGRTAAEMGMRILAGEPTDKLPVVTENTTQFAFDDLKLMQYGIGLDRLPRDSEIINFTDSSKKRVLVLNSYHKGMQWEDDIDTGLKRALDVWLKDVELFYDFMDVKRNPDPAFVERTYQTLVAKYTRRRFDAVLAVDDPAFQFVTRYRDTLFTDVPVVFCGVNYFDHRLLAAAEPRWFTGVVESYDLRGTIEAARKIQPEATRVVVINDTTPTGRANRQNIDRLVHDYAGELQFELWEEVGMSEIRSRVRELDGKTILLLLAFYRDGSNNVYSYGETISLISSVSPIPIYSVWDFYMGNGVLGGMLVSGENQGQAAGEMVGRILTGTRVSEIPLATRSPNIYMFDHQVMDRYGIATQSLPPSSMIINQPFTLRSFYQNNRGVANIFLLMVVCMAVLILHVYLQRKTLRIRNLLQRELQEARNCAELANIAKGRFLANMSHEIRTPMNGLIGMTELAMEKAVDPVQRGYLETVQRSGQSLLRVINDILDYSKIEAGKLELSVAPLDLRRLLKDVVLLFETSAAQKSVELILEIDPELPPCIVGDNIRLRQVLCNLVGNAVKFTEQGEVALTAGCRHKEGAAPLLLLTVRDTGTGIPVELQDRLFEDFSQLGTVSVKRGVGTGLGLSISRRLVELMGGTIAVTSSPGQGSTFSVAIPLLAAPQQAVQEDAPAPLRPAGARNAHILVAEDDEISQSLMQLVLEREGYSVTCVADGVAALETLAQKRFDLLVLDINMPDMSGLEVATAIRSAEPPGTRIPIVAMSANAMQDDREKGYAAGMDAYLTKPIEIETVCDTLDGLLRGANRPA